jgi:DNA-binding FadR family transcriptional regulator
MTTQKARFDFMSYLADKARTGSDDNNTDDPTRIPALTDLSQETGMSIATLREQLGVARAFGLVEVRPRTGIRLIPFSFTPAVYQSLSYAMACSRHSFEKFADLRRHVEANYWFEAVQSLLPEDHQYLQELVQQAFDKLHNRPVRVPHGEHRELHLTIFSRLDNPFVYGLMEAYWLAYENIGYNRYSDLDYLKKVWQYHKEIVDAICEGDTQTSYQKLLDHMALIDQNYGSKIE